MIDKTAQVIKVRYMEFMMRGKLQRSETNNSNVVSDITVDDESKQ